MIELWILGAGLMIAGILILRRALRPRYHYRSDGELIAGGDFGSIFNNGDLCRGDGRRWTPVITRVNLNVEEADESTG